MKKILQKIVKKKEKSDKKEDRKKSWIAGGLLLGIGILMVLFLGILLWGKFGKGSHIADFLPEKDLVGFASFEDSELNIFSENPEIQNFVNQKKTELFPPNFENITLWKGEKMGVAFYSHKENSQNIDLGIVRLREIKNMKEFQNFITNQPSQGEEDFQKFRIVKISEEYCTPYKGYFMCSPHDVLLKKIIEANADSLPKISETPEYNSFASKLPSGTLSQIFFRTEDFQKYFPDFAQKNLLLPIVDSLSAMGMSLHENTEKKQLSLSLLFIRKKEGEKENISQGKISYTHGKPEIFEYLPDNANSFLWGNNLGQDISQIFSYFEASDPAFAITLESAISTQVQDFFNEEISWKYDIFPLLSSEFLIGNNENGSFAILRTEDEEFAAAKSEKIKIALKKMAAHFVPQIVSHTLEDGTVVQEVFPNENAVSLQEKDFEGGKIFTMSAEDAEGKTAVSLSFGEKEGMLFFGMPDTQIEEILREKKNPDILKNFPVKFSGSEQEVFSFLPEFTKKYIPFSLNFKKISGKFIEEKEFFEIAIEAEL